MVICRGMRPRSFSTFLSGPIVLLLHAGLTLWLIPHRVPVEAPGMPVAVLVDLTPLPDPLPAPILEPQREPPPPVVEAPPEPPPPLPEIPTPPIPPPRPAVVLPKPPPPRPKVLPPKPAAVLPQPITAPVALPAVTAPPAQQSAVTIAGARANWQAEIVAWLARYKRYPRVAQEQHQQGTTVMLLFAVDRQGHVLSHQLARGSGFALLDEEAEALIQRPQPLPSLPQEVPGQQIELVVPIQFSLR
jgi:periplasmic protein TonB